MREPHRLLSAPAMILAAALGLTACQPSDSPTDQAKEQATEQAATPEPALASGIDWSGFNTEVRPQDDLFEHANGKWVAETELPADKARWGSFDMLRDQSEADVRALVEEVSSADNLEPGSAAQKIRDFYNAYMDTATADELGIAAIQAELDEIAAIDSREELFRAFARLGIYGVDGPIGGGIFSDLKDPDTNVVYLGESGLSLPDRDYYLKDDPQFVEGRQLYRDYVTRLFELAGSDDAAGKADALYALEAELAAAHWPREDNRNPTLTYNPKSAAELREMAPNIDWDATFEAGRVPARERYIVRQPSYFTAASEIITRTDLATWKDYLTFKTISAFAPVLSEPLFTAWFDFHRAGLQGIDAPRPRWKRAVNAINGGMGELLGQLYVAKHYRAESRERMETMIDMLIEAYRRSISELEWMGEETRQQALVKLSKFKPKIGYPDEWRDYGSLEIVAGDLVANIKSARQFEYRRNLDKLDRPVDKNEWFMSPQTVNAYYNPAWNEIVFPAAILQPPFFNVAADDAVNYGGIGAVIGHEIGHGFDDQGRKFDGDGNLRDWWTEEDNARFEERAAKLAAQYEGYEVIDGLTINGEFTSGENIGDLGGLGIAYKAWRLSLDGKEAPVIDGLTGEQRFFLGWAQVWRAKARDEETRRRLTVDPHSPPKFRANGAAVNIDAFYEAFDVQQGDGMYLPPEERVQIW
ncbi:MAG: M13 family metallopeptidase [Xanthomonadales bacterium]|nr:M13 family metallopeptidase [Xanthomonadales bacterium]